MKVEFVLRNLQALSQSLGEINVPLLLAEVPRFAAVSEKMLDVARKHKCSALFFNQEHEVNEQPSRADLWPAGEKEAHKRLRRFVSKRMDDHHLKRDVPAEPGTSEISP